MRQMKTLSTQQQTLSIHSPRKIISYYLARQTSALVLIANDGEENKISKCIKRV